ncbi:hypothetical protein [Halorubrum sp. DTA46]|uniref:hypothetical protein n=1 Tax=Halorubrum sp. DTA46 TaxID=3402162 RepID=UPI003AAC1AA7
MTDSNKKILATLLASFMMVSMVGAAFAPATAGASGPSGMLALGDAQVHEDIPEGADVPIGAADLEGAIYASDHADTLEAIVTTPERAEEEYLNAGTIVTNDEVALVLRDDEVHDGREVAVELALLETAVGFAPEVAYGVHESGEEWQSPIDKDGEVGVFTVPEFSDNTVTFSGGITLSGDAAGDGTTYEYEIDSLDGVDNFGINATGVENTATRDYSVTTTGEVDPNIGGTVDPPETTLTVEGNGFGSRTVSDSAIGVSDGYSTSVALEGSLTDTSESATPTIDLTGVEDTTHEQTTGTLDTSVDSVDIAGTADPKNAVIEIGPTERSDIHYPNSDGDGQIGGVWDGGQTDTWTQSANEVDTVEEVEIYGENYENEYVDVEVYVDGVSMGTERIESGYQTTVWDGNDVPVGNNVDMSIEYVRGNGGFSIAGLGGDDEYVELTERNHDISTTVQPDTGGSFNVESGTPASVDLTTDTSELSWGDSEEGFEWTLSYDASYPTLDPAVTVNGETVSHSGTLSEGEMTTLSLSDNTLDTSGGNTIELSLPTVSGPAQEVDLSYEFEELDGTLSPEVDATGDGTAEVSSGELLTDGETRTATYDPSIGDTWQISGSGNAPTVSANITEATETRDPVVEVNGHETSHTGTLADGETTSLATNEAWLEEGTNTVTVRTNSPATGPESLSGFTYAHDASGTTQSVEVDATSWTESFNVSNTYPSATADTNAVLTFSDRVAEIDDVEYRLNGGEWSAPPSHELNGTDLEVMIGDVDADTTVDVRATGHKIRTYDGTVDIVEPTVEGDELATEVEITEIADGGMFGLRVDGTELGDRIHYATEESWSGESAHVDVAASGTQILRAPDANVGSTMTVRSSPLSVEPESGGMEVLVEDGDEPRFSVREGETVGASTLDVTYYDTLPGERYVLWSATQDREIDADRASSPVYFTTDGSAETYTIRQLDREGSGGGGVPEPTGAVAPLVLVLPAVGLSVTGLFWAGRRFGGATGVRGNALLLVGSTVISAAALELVTPGSLIAQMWSATVFALGDAAASGLGAVVASIATLLGLWQIQARTRADIPAWVLIPTVSLAGVLALESIRPGSVLGALEGVIAEIGALLALILVSFAIYRWRASNQAEAQPDTEVTFDLGDQGGDD